ncbi:MAG TPA: nitroreductase family protein, partial [Bacteroidales bacterium]|nr:nitroreductase family protein [Bacteroidales bacterium]
LGTCIIGWFDEKRLKEILGIDKKRRVPLIVSLGYSEAPVRAKNRKSLEEISSWNKYRKGLG